MSFLSSYDNWDTLDVVKKRLTMLDCVRFYEEKAVQYVIQHLAKDKQKTFKREPVKLNFVTEGFRPNTIMSFGNNEVNALTKILEDGTSKSKIFFELARNTICAVFANMFDNTVSNPDKHTRFGKIAEGFMASITNEFAQGEQFENDMMQGMEETLSAEVSLSQD